MVAPCRGVLTFRNVLVAAGLVLNFYLASIFSTPGKFTEWSEWSNCSATCGGGIQERSRSCTNPSPGILGNDCKGAHKRNKTCNETPCPVNGGYSEWGKFGNCDKNCGGGRKARVRTCNNPQPKHDGLGCDRLGPAKETSMCNSQPCPVDGGFTNWSKYSECKMNGKDVCGKGKKERTRTCTNPKPQHGGKACKGPNKETADCEVPCSTINTLNISTSRTDN